MKISILLKTSEYRGDHSADITLAYDLIGDETVADLVRRIKLTTIDVIEIRTISHTCAVDSTCTCPLDALEPRETCPQHGAGEYPRHCAVCGKFTT